MSFYLQPSNAWKLGLIGVALFVLSTMLAGLQVPGYSHAAQLISESYAIGTAHGPVLRYFGFVPAGVCLALFCLSALRMPQSSTASKLGFIGLAMGYGLGTVLVGIFPCDEGCGSTGSNPSASQLIHNLVGLLTYMTVSPSLLLIALGTRSWPNAKWLSRSAFFSAVFSFLMVGVFLVSLHSEWVGLYQRLVEGSVLAWMLACALHLRQQASSGASY